MDSNQEPQRRCCRQKLMRLHTMWLPLLAVAVLAVACGASSHQGQAPGAASGTGSSPTPGSAATTPASAAATAPSPDSAVVAGHVSAGPVSPVSRPGTPDTRPVDGAQVEALSGSDVVAVTHTDSAGYFQFTLHPGTYVIAVTYIGLRGSAPMTKIVVATAGQTQTLDFAVDTGIR
jgi:Carboxypeptidase regulatory-like domain